MTKVSIHKKDTITNILETKKSPKICEAKFDKIKGEKDHSVTKVEYFSISLSIIDNTNRYDKKQTRKHTEYVNTIKTARMLHLTTVEYTFFLSTHETFYIIDHMQGDRTSYNIKIEIII